MAENKARLYFVDMVKGLGILSVIGYHLIAPSALRTVLTGTTGILLLGFFLFSGYLYTPGKRSFGENMIARVKSLLVPFFIYSICFWVIGTIYLLITDSAPFAETLACLRNFYAGCIWNRTIQNWFGWEYYSLGKRYLFLADFWFLLAMFFASALFFVITDHVKQSKGKQAAAIAVLLAATGILRGFDISLPYNLQIIPFWTAVMLGGYILKEWKLFELDFMRGGIGWGVSIAAIVSTMGANTALQYGTNLFRGTFDQPEPVTMLALFALGVVGNWGLASLCLKIEQAGMRVKELAWIGSNSLIPYLFHMLFAWLICVLTGFSTFYDPETVTPTIFAESILLTLAAIGLSVVTAIIINRATAQSANKCMLNSNLN